MALLTLKARNAFFISVDYKDREYDTNSVYDINFKIDAIEMCGVGPIWWIPLLTEWCPVYPEYWIKSYNYGGRITEFYYGFDERGNVTAIDIPYPNGKPYMRYEIEYVY